MKSGQSTIADGCYVHILRVTFPGCWISRLRAVKTDLIVGSGRTRKAPPLLMRSRLLIQVNPPFFFLFYVSLLLIIHKGGPPTFWTLPSIFAGSERVASCSLWQRFLRCGQSCLETPSSPFTCQWSYSSPEEGPSSMGNGFHCFEVLKNLATAQKSVKHFSSRY